MGRPVITDRAVTRPAQDLDVLGGQHCAETPCTRASSRRPASRAGSGASPPPSDNSAIADTRRAAVVNGMPSTRRPVSCALTPLAAHRKICGKT